jgi:hypothetical protein
MREGGGGVFYYLQYTVWPDGDNHLSGTVGNSFTDKFGVPYNQNEGGPFDLTCETDVLPAITWNDLFAQTTVTPPGDPP